MSITPEAKSLDAWLSGFNRDELEQIIRGALAQPPAPPVPAQPAKLRIQSLWPIKSDGSIDPRSELARLVPEVPAAPSEYDEVPDGVREALQRLIENGTEAGQASAEDALLVAKYRRKLIGHPAVPDAGVAREQSSGCQRLFIDEPFGYVTKTRSGVQSFYPQTPYLDTAVECEAVYTLTQVRAALAGQQGRVQAAEKAGSDVTTTALDALITRMQAIEDDSAETPGSDVTKAALAVIKTRDDFGWCREVDDAIEGLRKAYEELDSYLDSAARKGGESNTMSMAYIRRTYGVPARRGGRLTYTDSDGVKFHCTIKSATTSGHLMVLVDDRIPGYRGRMKLHPTWNVEYHEAAPA